MQIGICEKEIKFWFGFKDKLMMQSIKKLPTRFRCFYDGCWHMPLKAATHLELHIRRGMSYRNGDRVAVYYPALGFIKCTVLSSSNTKTKIISNDKKMIIDTVRVIPINIVGYQDLLDMATDYRVYLPVTAKPWKHQKIGVNRIVDELHYMLLWDMGVGKTFAASAYIYLLLYNNEFIYKAKRCIIICPNKVKIQWKMDLENFFGVTPDVIDSGISPKKRIKLFNESKLLIANTEILPYIEQYIRNDIDRVNRHRLDEITQYKEGIQDLRDKTVSKISSQMESGDSDVSRYIGLLNDIDSIIRQYTAFVNNGVDKSLSVFDVVIVDEIHQARKVGARSSLVEKIACNSVRKIGLTGSLRINGYDDLYNPVNIIKPGFLGHTKSAYLSKYCYKDKDNIYQLIPEMKNALVEKMATISMRVSKKSCRDMPPRVFSVQTYDLTVEQKKLYNSIVHDAFGVNEIVDSQIKQMHRLLMVCSGTYKDSNGVETIIKTNKEALLDDLILENINKTSILVWAYYEFTQRYLLNKYSHLNPVTAANWQEINTSKGNRIFIGNPSSCGTGTNMTKASLGIYYEMTYLVDAIMQSLERNYRLTSGGAKGMSVSGSKITSAPSVVCVNLCANNTIEQFIYGTVFSKIKDNEAFNDLLESGNLSDKQIARSLIRDIINTGKLL